MICFEKIKSLKLKLILCEVSIKRGPLWTSGQNGNRGSLLIPTAGLPKVTALGGTLQ